MPTEPNEPIYGTEPTLQDFEMDKLHLTYIPQIVS